MQILDVGTKFGMPVADIFEPWRPIIHHINHLQDIHHLKDIDLVCFGGGQDVHPSLYGHSNVASRCNITPSFRDLFEQEVFNICLDKKIPMFGICRGAQLTCALSGGKLIQDVGGHAGEHYITTSDGRTFPMTSTHHQMMYPATTEHELLAWSKNQMSERYVVDKKQLPNIEMKREPEVAYFPKTRVIAVQGHPEYYADLFAPAVVYTRDIVQNYLLKGK